MEIAVVVTIQFGEKTAGLADCTIELKPNYKSYQYSHALDDRYHKNLFSLSTTCSTRESTVASI